MGAGNMSRFQVDADLAFLPRVLAIADWYVPAYKAGGSVTAISNLIDLLGDEVLFYVFTRDRDLGDGHSYPNVTVDRWAAVGKAQVFYTADLSFRNLRQRIREIGPDIVYFNSFFSRLTVKALVLRKLGLLPTCAFVLAPRGEFSPGALELKGVRKWFYRKAAFAAGLCSDLLWQASSSLEEEHIRATIPPKDASGRDSILLAPDVPDAGVLSAPSPGSRSEKIPGAVRFVFLSRVCRKKNLHFALELLGSVSGDVQLDVYGPIDDGAYWRECAEHIRKLPKSVRVHYAGSVPRDQVTRVFSEYHFQLLPTLGENFGYVILESLAAGCPVLVSDQTPWRDLPQRGAGWDLPLADREQWRRAIQQCVDMGPEEYERTSQGARAYFETWMSSAPYLRGSVELFQKALERSAKPKMRAQHSSSEASISADG